MTQITIDASILDKFKDGERLRWWLDILFMANPDGELQTNLVQLMQRWRVSRDTVRYYLDSLVKDRLIKKQNQGRFFKLCVINFEIFKYQPHDNPTITPRQVIDNQLNPTYQPHDNPTITPQSENFTPRQNTDIQSLQPNEGHDEEKTLKKVSLLSPTPPINTLKNNIYINTNNTHAREDGFIQRYKTEGMWRDVGIILHQPVKVCQSLFSEFIREYRHNGQTHETYEDFKRHYIQWSRIAISKGQVELITKNQTKIISNEDILREMRS